MRWIVAVVAVALVAGCGGESKPITQSQAPPRQPKIRALPAKPKDVALIRRWADTLRAGHVTAASNLFKTPAIAQNGGGELLLQTQHDVRLFNGSLPCGAVLTDARRVKGGYILAVFRLTDRPGGDCGPGAGHQAAAAFRLKSNRIREWRRVQVPQFEQAQPAPQV